MSEAAEQTWDAPPEGSPCWIEIPARDLKKMKDFYAALFPSWKWKPSNDPEYEGRVESYQFTRPDGLTGGLVKMPEECGEATAQAMGSGFTVYYLVESIDKALPRIHELGGATLMGKTKEGKNGLFANVRDVEGNRFGIYEWLGTASE